MTSEIQNTNDKKVYDLEERTAQLGEGIIGFAILNTSRKGK
jgi:hypothetical protein